MSKELKINGILYMPMEENETEDDAIKRFENLIESVGIIENNSCTTFEEQEV